MPIWGKVVIKKSCGFNVCRDVKTEERVPPAYCIGFQKCFI